jgi:DNA-binding NarL/FixJ family response regulator
VQVGGPIFMRDALDAGASGYVLKDAAARELVREIRAAALARHRSAGGHT